MEANMTTIIKDKNDNNKQITLCNLLLRKNIETIVELVKIGENYDPLKFDPLALEDKLELAKVLIERWDWHLDAFIFSTYDKDILWKQLMDIKKFANDKSGYSVYGAEIIFSPFVPPDQCLAVSLNTYDGDFTDKNVAIFSV